MLATVAVNAKRQGLVSFFPFPDALANLHIAIFPPILRQVCNMCQKFFKRLFKVVCYYGKPKTFLTKNHNIGDGRRINEFN